MIAKPIVTTRKKLEIQKTPEGQVAQFLNAQIGVCGVSQKEIATHLGYSKPNIITMFKQGLTKLPIEKVALMAEVLGVDPMRLLKLVLTEYTPGVWETIQEVVGFAATENEREIIEVVRKATNDSDPKMTEDKKKRLAALVKTLK